jgi:hypothetical protein
LFCIVSIPALVIPSPHKAVVPGTNPCGKRAIAHLCGCEVLLGIVVIAADADDSRIAGADKVPQTVSSSSTRELI